MKIRDSGMPDLPAWEGFFEPERVLDALGLDRIEHDIADLGCGYGTFTLAAARRTRGVVHALDIEREMVDLVTDRARREGRANVRAHHRDFVASGSGLPRRSCGAVLLFNILHGEHPHELLAEARRILRPGGRVVVIHWIADPLTPRGPDLSIRPRPDSCRRWLFDSGFTIVGDTVPLPPWHWGLVGRLPGPDNSD